MVIVKNMNDKNIELIADAINRLAESIEKLGEATGEKAWRESLGHEICMGIRMGLFGAEAPAMESVGSLNEVARAIDDLGDKLGKAE